MSSFTPTTSPLQCSESCLPAALSHYYCDSEDSSTLNGGIDDKTDAQFDDIYDSVGCDSDIEQARPAYQHPSSTTTTSTIPARGSGRRHSLWARGIAAVSPFTASTGKNLDALPLLSFHGKYSRLHRSWFKRSKRSSTCCWVYLFLSFFAMLGVVQFISLACGFVISFFPDEIDRATDRWRQDRGIATTDTVTSWPTDISRDITPVGCHSHNDYWRRIPLYSALQAGCVGVEADVWLFDNELYVGHTTSSLTPSRTLRSMYINPLINILERQNPTTPFHSNRDHPLNGVFDTDPSQTLILLIDFKTDGEETWEHVYSQLSPLRERGYLTYYNGTGIVEGPITVVGTGNCPFNLLTANTTYRDIFFDAPLDRLVDDFDSAGTIVPKEERADNVGQGLSGIPAAGVVADTFDMTNSYYASVSFKKSIGLPWMFRLTENQIQLIRAQIQGAHRRGLKVRYWGTPHWPRSLRNQIWRVLVREGVDILNVDDLQGATMKEWIPRISDWWR